MIHDTEKLIFEQGAKGRIGVDVPQKFFGVDWNEAMVVPKELCRESLDGFPEVSEPEMIRHFTRLSQKNVGIDDCFYPLGSCTMKYNPRMNETIAGMEGFANIHPAMPYKDTQNAFRVLWELEQMLKEICGMDAFTLNPTAGAHGELTGLKIIREAFRQNGGNNRTKVLIPKSAHGTNPASAILAGFTTVDVEVGSDGSISRESLAKVLDFDVAAMMITNPSTHGLFEPNIKEIADILHAKGAYLYCDGANLNALVGIARPGDMGFDVIQTNMHKTFSTPHGGGGPGSGPVGVKKELIPFLPCPRIVRKQKENGEEYFFPKYEKTSIGRMHSWYGNFLVLLRAYSYIRTMGFSGLRMVAAASVLNANYLRVSLGNLGFNIPFDRMCMHECLLTDKNMPNGITTMDIAKRLLDKGFHPMTVYFPLTVPGAILIEPTETETKETLDAFIQAMKEIMEEAKTNPEILHEAPKNTSITRVDEVEANRPKNLNVRWK